MIYSAIVSIFEDIQNDSKNKECSLRFKSIGILLTRFQKIEDMQAICDKIRQG